MNLDLLVVGLVVLFAVLGALAGGLLQLTHVGAMLVAGIVAKPIGGRFGPAVAEHYQAPLVLGVLGVTVVSFFVAYAATQVVARILIKRVVKNRVLGAADHALGFAMGGVKSAGILFVLLSALIFFEKPIAAVSPSLRFDTNGSQVASFVRNHNLFTTFSFPGVKGLTTLARAATNPEEAQKLSQDPEFQQLRGDPRVKSILSDGSLAHSLQNGDYISVLRSNKVLEALSDPRLQNQLSSLGGTLSMPSMPSTPNSDKSKNKTAE